MKHLYVAVAAALLAATPAMATDDGGFYVGAGLGIFRRVAGAMTTYCGFARYRSYSARVFTSSRLPPVQGLSPVKLAVL